MSSLKDRIDDLRESVTEAIEHGQFAMSVDTKLLLEILRPPNDIRTRFPTVEAMLATHRTIGEIEREREKGGAIAGPKKKKR